MNERLCSGILAQGKLQFCQVFPLQFVTWDDFLYMRLAILLAALITATLSLSFVQAESASPQDNLDPALLYGGSTVPPDAPQPIQPPLRPAGRLQPMPLKHLPPARVAPVVKRPAPPPVPAPRFDPDAPPALSFAYPIPGGQINEGGQTIVWNTSGHIAQVRLTYSGEKCQLGGRPRGTFSGTVGKMKNEGKHIWAAPWLDAQNVKLRLVGYDAAGKELSFAEAEYEFLPAVCADKPDHCLVVSKARQRLWYLRGGRIKRMHLVSTAARGYTTPNMRPGSRGSRGAMGRVFSKAYAPVSRMYEVVMYYWLQITSSGSHGIHATSPPFYSRLGGPASHGCVRQHRADARILWQMVPVGTPVYIQ